MKKNGILMLICLCSTSVYSQKFETSLTVSPLMSLNSSDKKENKIAFGCSGSIQNYYHLTEKFDLGTALKYSFENYKFERAYDGLLPQNASAFFETKLAIHSLNIPLLLRLETKPGLLLNVGYGLNYTLNYGTSIDYVFSIWTEENSERKKIEKNSMELKNKFNSCLTAGIGKQYEFNGFRLTTEINYVYSFANFNISHGTFYESETQYHYEISPQYIGLKIGIGI